MDLAQGGAEGGILLLDALGVLAGHWVGWGWAAFDLQWASGGILALGKSEGNGGIAIVDDVLGDGPGWAFTLNRNTFSGERCWRSWITTGNGDSAGTGGTLGTGDVSA